MKKAIVWSFALFLLPLSYAVVQSWDVTQQNGTSSIIGSGFTEDTGDPPNVYNCSGGINDGKDIAGDTNTFTRCWWNQVSDGVQNWFNINFTNNYTFYKYGWTSVGTGGGSSGYFMEAYIGNTKINNSFLVSATINDTNYTLSTPITGNSFRFNLTDQAGNTFHRIFVGEYHIYGNISVATPDTTPPEIINYTLSTPAENCTNWNTNKSNPCSTDDVTPTVNITTDGPAWCAIGAQNINFSDYNNLGVNRNCTVGQGTKFLTCPLVTEDELVYDTSYIYISCEDNSKNQNRTSTSGALSLSITGLETAGRNSIGLGIQNALLSNYINYTDLQINARSLNNSQVFGTFDRAAEKGNKTWAFNRIGVSDSNVNMFNISSVLYTMEFANLTSRNLTNFTQALIEATD